MKRWLVVGGIAALGVMVYQPWRYTWAFGQDVGAAHAADWKNKSCSRALAAALYDDTADAAIATKRGNGFLVPGAPGHSYMVYGFRSQAACERARNELGSAQWDQSRPPDGSAAR